MLPPGGHPSWSSLTILCLGTFQLSPLGTQPQPDHLFPSLSLGSTDGGDRPWLSPDTLGYPRNASYVHSGGSQRLGGPREFLTHGGLEAPRRDLDGFICKCAMITLGQVCVPLGAQSLSYFQRATKRGFVMLMMSCKKKRTLPLVSQQAGFHNYGSWFTLQFGP